MKVIQETGRVQWIWYLRFYLEYEYKAQTQKFYDYMSGSVITLLSIYQINVNIPCMLTINLQLPMQSMPITTNVVSLNPAHGEVYSITALCDVSDLWKVCAFLRVHQFPPPVFFYTFLIWYPVLFYNDRI